MSNNDIRITWYNLKISGIKMNTEQMICVHLSDLHNKNFGTLQNRLLKKINECNPDIVCITGDVVDGRCFDKAEHLLRELVEIAPVFYVPGNHEYMSDNTLEIFKMIEKMGVNTLLDDKKSININGLHLTLYGLNDPYSTGTEKNYENFIAEHLRTISDTKKDGIKILLTHRPELYDVYSEYDYDLVLAGHAHGGQIRFPNGQGVIAPNQGLFPKYTQGMIDRKKTIEIISRGLGNSVLPLRVNNKPEIVAINIRGKKTKDVI